MKPKTPQESEIYAQMLAMLADQFYHQTGENITINRMELADMLTKQTMHGILLAGGGENSSTPEIPDNSPEKKVLDLHMSLIQDNLELSSKMILSQEKVEEIPQMAGTLEALEKITL